MTFPMRTPLPGHECRRVGIFLSNLNRFTGLTDLFNDRVVCLLILLDPTIPHLGVYPTATFAHMQNVCHTRLFVITNHGNNLNVQ